MRLAVNGLVAASVLVATAALGLVALVSNEDRAVSASPRSVAPSMGPDRSLPAPIRPPASDPRSERAFEPRSLPDPVPVAPETATRTTPLPTPPPTPGPGAEPTPAAQPAKGPGPVLAEVTSPVPPTPPVPHSPPTVPTEPTPPPTEVDPVEELEMHIESAYAAWGCTEEQGPPAAQLGCGLVAPGSDSTVLAFDVLVSDSAVLTATATTAGAVDPNPADNTIIAELAVP